MNKYTASEKQLMDALIATARTLGFAVMHIPDKLYAVAASQNRYDALSGAKGWPDVVAVGYGHMFVVEAKSATGRTFTEQDGWLEAFGELARGVDRVHVFMARPEDQDAIIELMVQCREDSWRKAS